MAKCLFCDDCTINLSNASGSATELPVTTETQTGGISTSAGLSIAGDNLNVTLSGNNINLFVEKLQVAGALPNCRVPPCKAYPCDYNFQPYTAHPCDYNPYGYQPYAPPCGFRPCNVNPWGNTS